MRLSTNNNTFEIDKLDSDKLLRSGYKYEEDDSDNDEFEHYNINKNYKIHDNAL